MGYVDRKDAGINPKKRLILTAGHLKDYLKQIESEHKFYELEMAEVVEVHLDETKSSFPKRANGKPNYAYYGGSLARYIVSEKGKPVDYLTDCKPLNPNIMTYPIVGEIVYVAQISEDEKGSKFYFSPFNFYGSPSHNLKPNLSIIDVEDKRDVYVQFVEDEKHKEVVNTGEEKFKTGYYHEVKNYPRLMAEEGDVVVEGRFGNTIRLGSDRETNAEGLDGSKITLHTGQRKRFDFNLKPRKENFTNEESSTIVIGTMTKQNISMAFTPQVDNFVKFPMSEIFINSNQIVLNTKRAGNIGLISSGNISIGALGETVIESPENGAIKLGGVDATEPGVLGKELKKVLDILLKAEIQKNTATIGKNEIERVASLPGGPMPNPQKVLSKTKENIKLQELNTKMTQMITAGPYLSKIVKTK